MMNLLHIDSSITGAASVSRQLTAAIVDRLRAAHPDAHVVRRDLAAEPIDHFILPPPDRIVLDEFLAADVIVIGAPMYNFTIPGQLKAWIDRIIVAGETFSAGPNGFTGLAGGRRVIVAVSSGGVYRAGTPGEALEHLESYLRAMFSVLGIQPEFVTADGLKFGDEHRAASIGNALESITSLAA